MKSGPSGPLFIVLRPAGERRFVAAAGGYSATGDKRSARTSRPLLLVMTIIQRCAARGCEGQVRFTRVRRLFDNYLYGRCDECGRKYRLFNGHPVASRRSRHGIKSVRGRPVQRTA